MQLTLCNLHELTHVWSKLVLKRVEVNEAIAVGVEDCLHQKAHVALTGKNLVLLQVCFEVFVAYVAIAVNVKRSENFKGLWLLTTSERSVLNFAEDFAKASSGCLIG